MTEVKLSLTIDQAEVVSEALDLYSRVGMGQIHELVRYALFGKIPKFTMDPVEKQIGSDIDRDRLEDAIQKFKAALGYSSLFGGYSITSSNVPLAARRAHEIQKVIDKELVEYSDRVNGVIDPFKDVRYDGLVLRVTNDIQVPKCEIDD